MFKTLLVKEIHDLVKTFRFSAALITMFLMIVLSAWMLGESYVAKRAEFDRLVSEFKEVNRQVAVPSGIAPVVFRPSSPLSIFALGEDANLGNAVEVSRWVVPYRADDYLTVNPLLHSMQSFDLLIVYTFALSLFGILFSFDAVSGEREKGMLKLICSYRVSRGSLYAVKFIAGVVVLSLPFLLSCLSALVIMNLVFQLNLTLPQWAAVGLIALLGIAFGSVFIALGLLCSAAFRSSSVALALALLLWTLLVILIPSLTDDLVKSTLPVLPAEEISTFSQQRLTEIGQQVDRYQQENRLDLSSNGSSNIGGYSPEWFDGELQWLLDHMKFISFYERLYQEWGNQVWDIRQRHLARKAEQHEISNMLKMLSPAHALRKSITPLTGTDYASHGEFLEQCRRYRQVILNDFENKGLFDRNVHRFFTRLELSDMTPEKIKQREEMYEREREQGIPDQKRATLLGRYGPLPDDYIPRFQYNEDNIRFSAALIPAGVLVFQAMLLFAAGYVLFLRYDVR